MLGGLFYFGLVFFGGMGNFYVYFGFGVGFLLYLIGMVLFFLFDGGFGVVVYGVLGGLLGFCYLFYGNYLYLLLCWIVRMSGYILLF